jgi:hypothetical protein
MLTTSEQQALNRAYNLIEITKLPGWDDIQSLLSDIAQKHYPDPKDKRYQYFPWKQIEKDYTFARGATEAAKEFVTTMLQQKSIATNLQEKADKKRGTHRIGE